MKTELGSTDLVVDRVYEGGRRGNSSDDPLPALIGVDNGAGFRHLGARNSVRSLKLLALKSSLTDPLWPDALDRDTGIFVYYGDNRHARELHDTPRQGNLMLRNMFAEAHNESRSSSQFPPILLFANADTHRDVRFLGLAVPGALGMTSDEDLVAVWRTTGDRTRFQNYKATFTVLDVPVLPRAWIRDAQEGRAAQSEHAPKPWLEWVRSRRYKPLISTPSITIRTRQEQTPAGSGLHLLKRLTEVFQAQPTLFEACAVEIARFWLPAMHSVQVTRPWRDGGRDATGLLRLGSGAGSIDVEFALEAKLYKLSNAVGVREVSRLISRLRHRQFGILVTTSYLHDQAYKEVVLDGHPIVIISAADIAQMLTATFSDPLHLGAWLAEFIKVKS